MKNRLSSIFSLLEGAFGLCWTGFLIYLGFQFGVWSGIAVTIYSGISAINSIYTGKVMWSL